jgi:hypothetical protein
MCLVLAVLPPEHVPFSCAGMLPICNGLPANAPVFREGTVVLFGGGAVAKWLMRRLIFWWSLVHYLFITTYEADTDLGTSQIQRAQ